jgi:hypothetical protein
LADPDTFKHTGELMLTKLFVLISLSAVAMTACTDDAPPCVGHGCLRGPVNVMSPEAGSTIFEYIYFDTELQAAFKLPAGVTTVNRVMAYFMDSQTPNLNPLPTPGQCNNLVTTKGWPQTVGNPHVDLDVGSLTITGKNKAGTAVTIDVPKQPAGTDSIGRPHDTYYQIISPDAPKFLAPDSFYTVNFGGAGAIKPTTLPDALFLAADFTVTSPELEDNGPLIAGTDFPVKWNPAVSTNKPPANQMVGGDVLGVTWLVDVTGAPTHICPTAHSDGHFTIPGSAITEYKAAAASRGQITNKVILLRNAIVHQLVQLPNGEANNVRRVDMLTLVCWAQLMDVQ